jgi:hypothetical protein
MSYSSPCGESRIWQFSNPNVSIDGYPTGIDHNVDPAKSADSARNMNNTASTIAAYRQGAATPPQAPGNLNASPMSDDQINLQWTDNSSDESGFQLEQSTDGANWNAIATVGAGTSTYADNGLTASTTYYYRVRAYNSGGSSNWSNTVSGQTLLAPLPPSSPNPLSATAVSGNRVDLAWTNVGNENGYRLERSPDGSAYTLIANPSADENIYNDTDLAPNTTYYYRVVAFNGGGESATANASVKTHAFIVHSPVAEYSTYGSITGSHSNLGSNDDITEALAEVQSGGKRNRRHSRLEHRWEFNLSAGTSAVLLANAWKSGTSEDNFIFEYSTDGSSYTPMFTVSSTDSANEQSALLPSGVGGTLYVRVTDTDRQSGHSNIESVHVDQLVVRVDGGDTGTPSATPGNLNATPMSSNQVSLSWTDLSDNEIGFEVERTTGGGSWQKLGNAPTNATAYQDNDTVGGARYDYRIRSYNVAGASSWQGPVATQTPAGIDLVADGRKIKSKRYADLTWAGGSGQPLLIYRGSSLIDTVSGSSSSYTDSTLPRGGGSYSYQVCESGELTICSNAVTVF